MANRFDNIPGLPQLYQQQSMVVEKPFIGTKVPNTPLKAPLDLYKKELDDNRKESLSQFDKQEVFKGAGRETLDLGNYGGKVGIYEDKRFNGIIETEINPYIAKAKKNIYDPASVRESVSAANNEYHQNTGLQTIKKNQKVWDAEDLELSKETTDPELKDRIYFERWQFLNNLEEERAAMNAKNPGSGVLHVKEYIPAAPFKSVNASDAVKGWAASMKPYSIGKEWLVKKYGDKEKYTAGELEEFVTEARQRSGFGAFFENSDVTRAHVAQLKDKAVNQLKFALTNHKKANGGKISDDITKKIMKAYNFGKDDIKESELKASLEQGDYSQIESKIENQAKNLLFQEGTNYIPYSHKTTIGNVNWGDDDSSGPRGGDFNINDITGNASNQWNDSKGTDVQQLFAKGSKAGEFGEQVDPNKFLEQIDLATLEPKDPNNKALKSKLMSLNGIAQQTINEYLIKKGLDVTKIPQQYRSNPARYIKEQMEEKTKTPFEYYKIAMIPVLDESGLYENNMNEQVGSYISNDSVKKDASNKSSLNDIMSSMGVKSEMGSLYSGDAGGENLFAKSVVTAFTKPYSDKTATKYDRKDPWTKAVASGVLNLVNDKDNVAKFKIKVDGKEYGQENGTFSKWLKDVVGIKNEKIIDPDKANSMTWQSDDYQIYVKLIDDNNKTVEIAFSKNDPSAMAQLAAQMGYVATTDMNRNMQQFANIGYTFSTNKEANNATFQALEKAKGSLAIVPQNTDDLNDIVSINDGNQVITYQIPKLKNGLSNPVISNIRPGEIKSVNEIEGLQQLLKANENNKAPISGVGGMHILTLPSFVGSQLKLPFK